MWNGIFKPVQEVLESASDYIDEYIEDVMYNYISINNGWISLISNDLGMLDAHIIWAAYDIGAIKEQDPHYILTDVFIATEIYRYNTLVNKYNDIKPFFMPKKGLYENS